MNEQICLFGMWFSGILIGFGLRGLLFRGGRAKRVAERFASVSGSASDAAKQGKHDLFYQAENGQQLPIGGEEVNCELLPRAVQLPVSDLLAVVENWKGCVKETEKYSRQATDMQNFGDATHWSSIGTGITQCINHLEKIIAKSDTPQRVSSGGS